MIIMVFLLLAVLSFFSGFLCGMMRAPKKATENNVSAKWESEIDEEYENFLRYDGSEQF